MGPEAEARLVAKDLAWLQKNLGADSGAGLYGLYLLYREDIALETVAVIAYVKKKRQQNIPAQLIIITKL